MRRMTRCANPVVSSGETSSEAALKGFKVVVAVDLTTAITTYAEQFVTWQLATGPIISPNITTLTTSNMIKF